MTGGRAAMELGDLRRPRLGNPLSWRVSDRCYAIALLLSAITALVGLAYAAGGWPFAPPESGSADLIAFNASACTAWAVMAVVARLLRGRERAGLPLAFATVWLYALTLAAFTLFTGPFGAPGWVGFLGGAVIGYVVFPRWIALTGLAFYVAAVIVGAVVMAGGHLDGTILGQAARAVRVDHAAIVRGAVSSVLMSALTFTIIVWIVERWRDREARFARLATTDPLTAVGNRRVLFDHARRELARTRRYQAPTSLILVDLDHFKAVNDRFGHLVGDGALVHAAGVLREAVRDVDVIARYGGEEFGILLPSTDLEGACEVAERCRARLAGHAFRHGGEPITITASFGVATTAGEGDVDDLLRRADDALLRAKRLGRDRVERARAEA